MNIDHLTWVKKYLTEIYQTPILENFLELEISELTSGKAVFWIKIGEKHSNIYGFAHGGILASLADVVMGAACITLGKRIVTIDLNINFIKGAPTESSLTATGLVISNGNTIIRAETGIRDEDRQLIVTSQASYFVTGDFNARDYPQPVISKK